MLVWYIQLRTICTTSPDCPGRISTTSRGKNRRHEAEIYEERLQKMKNQDHLKAGSRGMQQRQEQKAGGRRQAGGGRRDTGGGRQDAGLLKFIILNTVTVIILVFYNKTCSFYHGSTTSVKVTIFGQLTINL